MNRKIKIAVGVAAGLALFGGAYLGFALMLGASVGEILPLGRGPRLDAPTARADAAPVEAARQPPVVATAEPVRPAGLGLLDVFQIEAPFSRAELQQLVDDLKRKHCELDEQRSSLAEREQRVLRRAELLDEQYAELQALRLRLDEWTSELAQRQADLEQDETARSTRDQASWTTLGKLFAEGDAAELGERLATYSPGEAAKILHTLRPARAKELLDSLAPDKWKQFAEAYRTTDAARQ